jgi:hypothetical protein
MSYRNGGKIVPDYTESRCAYCIERLSGRSYREHKAMHSSGRTVLQLYLLYELVCMVKSCASVYEFKIGV